MEASMDSCVHGFHVYQDIWTPVMGEILVCRRETTNVEDRYAVAVYKSEEVVGYVPRKISFLCAAFIRRGGTIHCTVNASRRYSRDLAQGGMEIPCKLTFQGPLKELQKVQRYFSSALKIQIHITNTSVLHSFPTTDIDTSKESPLPGKRGQDIVSAECPQEKRAKYSESVSSSNTTTSLDSSVESPVPKKHAMDIVVIEMEKHVVHATTAECESAVTGNNKKIWVQLRRNTLMMEDKFIIEGGLRLTDKHINFASCLISHQFPQIGGLRTTILQTRYYCFPSQSIQAIFCKRREH